MPLKSKLPLYLRDMNGVPSQDSENEMEIASQEVL